jgi:hypothetical protein
MAFPVVPLAISAISALSGGLGNRSQMPKLDPALAQLRQQLIDAQFKIMNGGGDNFAAGQIDDLNESYDLEKQRLGEILASRGVSGPAVGFAEAGMERNRFSDIRKIKQAIPFLNLQSGQQLFQTLQPSGTGTQGNVLAGATGNFANTLAYFLGQGAFSKQNTTSAPPSPTTPAPRLPSRTLPGADVNQLLRPDLV